MEGVVKALDMVQGENHEYSRCFLPTLAIELRRPRVLIACGRLVGASMEGMESFWDVFKKLAAAFHCMFLRACMTHDVDQVYI